MEEVNSFDEINGMNAASSIKRQHHAVEAELIEMKDEWKSMKHCFGSANLTFHFIGYAAAGKKRKNQQLFHPFNFMELN